MDDNGTAQRPPDGGGVYRLEDFWRPDDEVFLDNAFQAILGRPPDPESLRFFAQSMGTGHFSRIEVLGYLRNTPEGERRDVKIRGLPFRFLMVRVARRLPFLGSLIRFLLNISLLPTEVHSLRVGLAQLAAGESCPNRRSINALSSVGGAKEEEEEEPQWAGDPRAATRARSATVRPFDFVDLTCESNRKLVPDWFRTYWQPDGLAHQRWEEEYRRALRGEDYELPEDTMRHPSNELHQRMAMHFWKEVPKDFSSILDVGCSDGFMVKVFQEAGKRAVGINDFLYPTDRLFIDNHSLQVQEMDMHALEFGNSSFDAVWCRHTLEHSFAPLRVLSEIYRALQPGGYLFIVLPPPPIPAEFYPGHWHQIPDYQLGYLLRLSNFTILELRTAWFSFHQERDNLEIRAICRKEKLQI